MKRVCSTPLALLILIAAAFPLTAAAPTSDVTPLQQVFIMKELKPDLERIGVLADKSVTEDEVIMSQINRAAAGAGVKVFLAAVESIRDVAPMYRGLRTNHDVQTVWVVTNGGAMSENASRKFVIKEAARDQLPVLAPTEEWVDEGATVALKIEDGQVRLIVNKATSEAVGLTIPAKYAARTAYLAAN